MSYNIKENLENLHVEFVSNSSKKFVKEKWFPRIHYLIPCMFDNLHPVNSIRTRYSVLYWLFELMDGLVHYLGPSVVFRDVKLYRIFDAINSSLFTQNLYTVASQHYMSYMSKNANIDFGEIHATNVVKTILHRYFSTLLCIAMQNLLNFNGKSYMGKQFASELEVTWYLQT